MVKQGEEWVVTCQVQGLCGNYNSDSEDDQKAPSGTLSPNAATFGDSWRLHSYCPKAEPVKVGLNQMIILHHFVRTHVLCFPIGSIGPLRNVPF